jgi:competence protein ComEC
MVAALVTGDQRAIERADWDIFRATGVAHLMSISGLHITLFAWLAAALIGGCGGVRPRGWRLCLAHARAAPRRAGRRRAAGHGLCAVQRLGRAGAAHGADAGDLGALQLSGRRWPWPQVWLLACAVVVAVDPWALTQAGFWLSFVAVGCCLLLIQELLTLIDKRWGRFLCQLLREQWVVTLALTPLSLLLFGQVSVVGLLANLLAIPWVTLVVTPLALAGVLWAPLWEPAAWALGPWRACCSGWPAWPWARCRWPPRRVGGRGGGGRRRAAGHALAVGRAALACRLLLPLLCGRRRALRRASSSCWRPTSGRATPCSCAPPRHTWCTTPARASAARATPATACWCRCCARWASGWTLLVLSHRDSRPHRRRARRAGHAAAGATLLVDRRRARAAGAAPATRCQAGQRWTWDGVAFEVLHPHARRRLRRRPPAPTP